MTICEMVEDYAEAIAYAQKWRDVIREASRAEWLEAAWDSLGEQTKRAAIQWPPGALGDLGVLVQAKIDQLSRLDSGVRP